MPSRSGVPVSNARREKAKGMRGTLAKERVHERGDDIIYVVSTGATPPTIAQVLGAYYVNPLALLSGTRVAALSALYQKFRFTKFRLVWEPELATTFSGRVWAVYMANPNDELPGTGTRLLQELTNLPYKLLTPAMGGLELKDRQFSVAPSAMVNSPGQKYITDVENSSEFLDCYQGRLLFGCDGPLVANTTYGTWKLDWGVEFYDPIANPSLNAGVVQYLMTADAGQSKPFGSAPASVIFGDPAVASVGLNPTSTANAVTPGDEGSYNLIAYYPAPSGGAGLTSSSTIAAVGSGVTINNSDVAYEYAQTGKRWAINFTCSSQNATGTQNYITVLDSAGTHPSTACVVTIIKYRPLVPLPKNEKARRQAALERDEFRNKIALLEKRLSAPTPLGPVLEISEQSTTESGGQAPPTTTTTTALVSQLLPIETAVVAPEFSNRNQSKWTLLQGGNDPNLIDRLRILEAKNARLRQKKQDLKNQVSSLIETSDEEAQEE